MEDYKKLIDMIRICYDKASTEEEVNTIHSFIAKINDGRKECTLDIINILKGMIDIKQD